MIGRINSTGINELYIILAFNNENFACITYLIQAMFADRSRTIEFKPVSCNYLGKYELVQPWEMLMK